VDTQKHIVLPWNRAAYTVKLLASHSYNSRNALGIIYWWPTCLRIWQSSWKVCSRCNCQAKWIV